MAVNVTQKDKTLHDTIGLVQGTDSPNQRDDSHRFGREFSCRGTVRVASRHRTLRGTVGIFRFHAVGSAKSERENKPLMLPEDTISCLFSGFWRDCQSCFFRLY